MVLSFYRGCGQAFDAALPTYNNGNRKYYDPSSILPKSQKWNSLMQFGLIMFLSYYWEIANRKWDAALLPCINET